MIDRNGKKIYNCPNCAAPIGYSDKCEYCGTLLRWIPFDEMKIETVKELVLQKLKDMLA